MHTVEVYLVVGHSVEHGLDHHLEHDAGERSADTAVRPQAERDVIIRRAVQHHVAGPVELLLVVVGRAPTDEDAVV